MSKYRNVALTRVPTPDEIDELAGLYQSFSDPTRLRIMMFLFEAERSVGEIAGALQMSHSAISHQLRHLKQVRLVKGRREGKYTYYSLQDSHVRQLIEQGLEHIYE